jgi:hypothetical protein
MSYCVVIPLHYRGARGAKTSMLSRAAALRAHGAAPTYPSASWSGIRNDDGMVLFVLCAEDILADSAGTRCLLWSPGEGNSPERCERLEHCIRAIEYGQAEALLASARGMRVDPRRLLAVRVERYRREYWAKWGSAGHAAMPPAYVALGHGLAAA